MLTDSPVQSGRGCDGGTPRAWGAQRRCLTCWVGESREGFLEEMSELRSEEPIGISQEEEKVIPGSGNSLCKGAISTLLGSQSSGGNKPTPREWESQR